uniref:NADH-ubiquinone oxidoreductase chain 2 n=1 Tax=Lanthanaphalara mira TaxID=2218050 RepID=A0A344A2F7_9HEMI|nr:NADH dehydrogenase subunit 2 [Lanthanaphalara mira]AWU48948.1 NADH dehydrogenase subunit 2 [Lanthanaphalara mira]
MLFYFLMLIPMLILSILLSISSHSWMMIWMGMEVNLIVFIMINLLYKNLFTMESSMKYFLIQSLGSLIFLVSLSFNSMMYEEWPYLYMYSLPMAMMLKSGLSPFHSWTPEVISKMSYLTIFLFLTLQKLVPLTISFCSWMEILMMSSLLNIIVGSIGGMIQSSLIKILIFSSMSNAGWMIISLSESFMLFMMYFVLYMMMTSMIMITLSAIKLKWMIQLKSISKMEKIMFYCLFFSFSGLPPFLGFTPKWMILDNMHMHLPLTASLCILTSLMTMFFYLKSSMTMLFLVNLNNKWATQFTNFELSNVLMLTINFTGIPMFFILT